MVVQRLAVLERGWVPNDGQWDERAAFAAPGYFGTTWVTQDGELRHVASKREDCEKQSPGASEPDVAIRRFQNPCPVQSWVLTERWVGGKVQVIRGEEELETKVSFFIGNDPARHRSALPSYRYLSLGEVWPGVEVKLKASQKTVEKLFYVRPGADLGKVRVELRGANRLRLSQEGELVIETGLGELKLSKPVAWQEKDGQKLPVQASYRLFGKNRYGFAVQGADPRLPLVIDPILQATYLGGNGDDFAFALAVAGSGDVYVAGYTRSSNFPNTSGGAQASYGGGYADAFVARLNATLTSILQSTYLGGSDNDGAWALAIHPSTGEVYVAGNTLSWNFPNTAGGAQPSKGGNFDAFVARLNEALTQNPQSTYLGGSRDDLGLALAIAGSGDVYVAGYTDSTNFPNTAGGAQQTPAGNDDAFVARLNASLTSNLQSTYLGGGGADRAYALAIAGSGDVYVAGWTASTNFPHTAGGAQASFGGVVDAFVARLTADLAASLASFTLSISPTPTGGNVTSSPEGINCGSSGSTCSASFPSGTTVTLTATPDTGYIFVGWGGHPDCTDGSVTMDGDKTCTATFQLQSSQPPPSPPEKTVSSPTGSGQLTFRVMDGPMLAALDVEPFTGTPPVSPPSLYQLPHGVYSLTVEGIAPGASITIQVRLPSPAPVGTVWLKLIGGRWVALPVGSDDGDNVITVTLTDGGQGDADGVANGVITDPGGPAIPLRIAALWGDVDCDGVAGVGDALKVLRHVVRLPVTARQPCPRIEERVLVAGALRAWGDVDGDGVVGAVDALKILRHLLRLSVSRAAGTPSIGGEVEVSPPGE
jgi:hypothetical protein